MPVGVGDWYHVTRETVGAFAALTGDDVERARPQDLLMVSLGAMMTFQVADLRGIAFVVNYGYGSVRFPAALPCDAWVRMHARPAGVDIEIVDGPGLLPLGPA